MNRNNKYEQKPKSPLGDIRVNMNDRKAPFRETKFSVN
jgi:hypothetical protein